MKFRLYQALRSPFSLSERARPLSSLAEAALHYGRLGSPRKWHGRLGERRKSSRSQRLRRASPFRLPRAVAPRKQRGLAGGPLELRGSGRVCRALLLRLELRGL